MTCVPVGLAAGRRGQSEQLKMTIDMFSSGASNALPVEGHSTLHVSAPLFVQYSQIVPYMPVPAGHSGQVSGQIAPLQQSSSYQVAELNESEAPPCCRTKSIKQ